VNNRINAVTGQLRAPHPIPAGSGPGFIRDARLRGHKWSSWSEK
jgi:hypothetical protein